MNICVILKDSSYQVTSIDDFLKKMKVEVFNLRQDDFSDLKSLSERFNLPELSSLEGFFSRLELDDYLADIAKEILDWGFWIAENEGYDSVHYDSITILKYGSGYSASETYDRDETCFVVREFFRYVVNRNIDNIVGIYSDATGY